MPGPFDSAKFIEVGSGDRLVLVALAGAPITWVELLGVAPALVGTKRDWATVSETVHFGHPGQSVTLFGRAAMECLHGLLPSIKLQEDLEQPRALWVTRSQNLVEEWHADNGRHRPGALGSEA